MKRRQFIKLGLLGTAATGIAPGTFLKGRDCDLTSDDILGPYWSQNHPYRTVLAHTDEPGTRIFISGMVQANDCETPLHNAIVDVWHANDSGCYTVFQECNSGNPEEDPYNLRGQMLTNENGEYAFESIWPGHYGSRPKHFHYKITTPENQELVTQCYFEGDAQIDEQWENNHPGLIIPLEESDNGLYGVFDIIMDEEAQVGIENELVTVPEKAFLNHSYPNPFNNSTQIEFGLSRSGHVSISIYNVSGRWITNLTEQSWRAGTHLLKWNGQDSSGKMVPSGSYLVVMKAAGFTGSKKILLLK